MEKIKSLLVLALFAMVLASCNNARNTEGNEDGKAKVEVQSDELKTETSAANQKDQQQTAQQEKAVHYLTTEEFREKVWDYRSSPDKWKYLGELPCVIDFYADWCRPCKMVAPIMEELAKKYEGKVIFYKVNTDKEKELASVFQIRSIPSILFVPAKGDPKFSVGAMQKEDYIKIIESEVLGNK